VKHLYDKTLKSLRCDVHAQYQQIIASRTAFDAAVSAAQWEEWELCQVTII